MRRPSFSALKAYVGLFLAACLSGYACTQTTPLAQTVPTSQTALTAGPAETPPRAPDVIFVPTPHDVVDRMLELAEVKKGDVVYDLGCGDGRIVVAAAKKYGVRAVGFDIDPQCVKEAIANVKANGVEDLVTIKQADIFTLDLRAASVITLYLLPSLNVQLMPQLAEMKPGSRIVSHDFHMPGARPVKIETVTTKDDQTQHAVYKWVVPWEDEAATNN